jgi:DNA primase
MEFFKKFFQGNWIEMDTGELSVLCPFPHKDEKGNQYYESVPSAHINQSKSLFHCKVCGRGLSEANFLKEVQGLSYKDALVLLKEMEASKGDNWTQFRSSFLNSAGAQAAWTSLGLDLTTADALQIGYEADGISFPVYIYGELLDVRNYKAGRTPKVRSRKGAKVLLLPFDLWRVDDRPTLLCAGEKDMAIARQMGFNALTFTGGEQAFPKLFKHSFKGKKVYIAYDNDQAGHEGSRKIASLLKDVEAIPYVVTGHYSVCTEKGEDIHDFFIKYGKSMEDLTRILESTPEFSEEDHRTEQQKYIPLVTITEAMQGQYANRLVSSRVSVVATYEEAFHVPDYVELTKFQEGNNKDTMAPGEQRVYTLDEENVKDILLLMDSNLKEEQIKASVKSLVRIPPKELNVSYVAKSRSQVFKAVVTDDLESETVQDSSDRKSMRELLVYSIGEQIQAGTKYRIFYKPVGHPLKGQQVVGIVTKLEESDTSINRFSINDNTIESLKCFQVKSHETVADKMNELYERSKGIIGVEARKDVFYATDMYFHTPLEFNFGKRSERGYLDVMIVGDERTGKSQTAKKLLQQYELGLITSLKTATVAGLLGGSDQTAGGWKTKLGLIPRNHKGALILEEFSGGGQELISKLTEVRSSNRVRLTRVNGTIDVPAQVRMLSISNPATNSDGTSTPLKNYPHGIKILLDLVGASADLARYDYFVLVEDAERYISPLEDFEQTPFPKESYQNRIRWVWSRKPEQIIIPRDVEEMIVKQAQELNDTYNSHIKLFGPEAWKKLARMAIATAGLVCSMSDDGLNLIVRKEHVEWAKQYLVGCYDNSIFKLREYVEAHRSLVECNEDAVVALQGMYGAHPIMLKQLELSTEMNQRDLQMVSGLEQKEFMKVLNQLVRYSFIEYGAKIQPTVRFRTAMQRIDKNTFMKRIGEH